MVWHIFNGIDDKRHEDKTKWTVYTKSALIEPRAAQDVIDQEKAAAIDNINALIQRENRTADVKIFRVGTLAINVRCDEAFAEKIRALPGIGEIEPVKIGHLQSGMLPSSPYQANQPKKKM